MIALVIMMVNIVGDPEAIGEGLVYFPGGPDSRGGREPSRLLLAVGLFALIGIVSQAHGDRVRQSVLLRRIRDSEGRVANRLLKSNASSRKLPPRCLRNFPKHLQGSLSSQRRRDVHGPVASVVILMTWRISIASLIILSDTERLSAYQHFDGRLERCAFRIGLIFATCPTVPRDLAVRRATYPIVCSQSTC